MFNLFNRTIELALILANIVLAGLGVYGYFWRNAFLTGDRSGPLWLLLFYESTYWNFFLVGIAVFLIFWVFSLLGRIFSNLFGGNLFRLWFLARLALILSGISAIPACQTTHDLVDTITFNEQTYHLLRADEGNGSIYGVLGCQDRVNFSCRMVNNNGYTWHGAFVPPAPTMAPQVQATAEVGGQVVMLEVEVPQVNAPAELEQTVYLVQGGTPEAHLNLRVENTYIGIAIETPAAPAGITEATPTPP